jgi:hypothetical protein
MQELLSLSDVALLKGESEAGNDGRRLLHHPPPTSGVLTLGFS